jgi:hypothetical protein
LNCSVLSLSPPLPIVTTATTYNLHSSTLPFSTLSIHTTYESRHVRHHPLDNGSGPAQYVKFIAHDRDMQRLRQPCIAKPTAALIPFTRAAPVAFIHSSSTKSATMERPGLVKGNPGTPPPMKKGMPTNVPLPSQEGKQGVMQYALYVQSNQKSNLSQLLTVYLQDHS